MLEDKTTYPLHPGDYCDEYIVRHDGVLVRYMSVVVIGRIWIVGVPFLWFVEERWPLVVKRTPEHVFRDICGPLSRRGWLTETQVAVLQQEVRDAVEAPAEIEALHHGRVVP